VSGILNQAHNEIDLPVNSAGAGAEMILVPYLFLLAGWST